MLLLLANATLVTFNRVNDKKIIKNNNEWR